MIATSFGAIIPGQPHALPAVAVVSTLRLRSWPTRNRDTSCCCAAWRWEWTCFSRRGGCSAWAASAFGFCFVDGDRLVNPQPAAGFLATDFKVEAHGVALGQPRWQGGQRLADARAWNQLSSRVFGLPFAFGRSRRKSCPISKIQRFICHPFCRPRCTSWDRRRPNSQPVNHRARRKRFLATRRNR
jgi:hypothetical protein